LNGTQDWLRPQIEAPWNLNVDEYKYSGGPVQLHHPTAPLDAAPAPHASFRKHVPPQGTKSCSADSNRVSLMTIIGGELSPNSFSGVLPFDFRAMNGPPLNGAGWTICRWGRALLGSVAQIG
jgi:hypothetical protein